MSSKLSEQLKVIVLAAYGQINSDTTTTGSGVAAGLSVHRAMAVITITAVGGATGTYTFTIEGSNTSISTGFELAHASGEPSTMAATFGGGVQQIKIGLNPYKWYRYKLVTITSSDVTYLINAMLQPSKLPAAAQAAS